MTLATVPDRITAARDRLGEAIFLKVAGPEGPQRRDRIHGTPGPRWFPAGSPIHRVHGDASMFIGGMRALMFQSLHPVAMYTVATHSGFKGDLWGRLARTSTFLATTTYAVDSDAQAAVDLVKRIHDSIAGTMPDGTPYAANDPHLLQWVHIAEIDSFLRTHQRYGARPLDQEGRDTYVAQTATVAAKLGVLDPPRSEAELAERIASYLPELRGSEEARDAVRFLIWHPELPLAARPAYLVLAAAAAADLPRWARTELGLPSLAAVDRSVVPVLGRGATALIRWALAPPPPDTHPDTHPGSVPVVPPHP